MRHPKPAQARHLFGPMLLTAALLFALTTSATAATSEDGQGEEACSPRLELSIEAGEIVVTLDPSAAAALIDPLRGLGSSLTFDWASPNGFVRTSAIPELEGLDMEIGAESLGLDRDLINDPGEAMEVMQHEVLEIHAKNKHSFPTPQFAEWIETWRAERQADFLVGVSRKELLEAFGYRFSRGIESQPVTRGAVAIRPQSPNQAEPHLVFSLVDRPDQTGRWLVIGRVVRGIELLREVSVSELTPVTSKKGTLASPEPVTSLRIRSGCSDFK